MVTGAIEMKNIVRKVIIAILSSYFLTVQTFLAANSKQSYLEASDLFEAYKAMYSSIYSMSVSYVKNAVEVRASHEDPNIFDNMVRFQYVDRIEKGTKYYIRTSYDPNGFENAESITEHAFDGSVTTHYYPREKSGGIAPGMAGLSVEEKNDLLMFMLLNKVTLNNPEMRKKYTDGLPFIELLATANCRVRPQLQKVADEWCHAVDLLSRSDSSIGATIWFAVEKGCLPIKYENYNKDRKCKYSITVDQIGYVETETGGIWYPLKAALIYDDSKGYRRYQYSTVNFKPNVETTKETFKVSFPPRTRILDRVTGTYYTIGPSDLNEEIGVFGVIPGYEDKTDKGQASGTGINKPSTLEPQTDKSSSAAANELESDEKQTIPKERKAALPPAMTINYRTVLLALAAIFTVGIVTVWYCRRIHRID
jgi:hypothetical protein